MTRDELVDVLMMLPGDMPVRLRGDDGQLVDAYVAYHDEEWSHFSGEMVSKGIVIE